WTYSTQASFADQVCSCPQCGHLKVCSVRLLLLREAASILVPAGAPSPDAGTPSPDSAHLIITWPSGLGSRIIGVAYLAEINERAASLKLFLPGRQWTRKSRASKVERFVSPQRPSGCSTKMTAATAGSFISRCRSTGRVAGC